MYELSFTGTNSAGWAGAIEAINDTNDEPLDLTGVYVTLTVQDGCNYTILRATSDEGIERPTASVIQWRFGPDQCRSLRPGRTYQVGCTLKTDGGTTQLFTGDLAWLDGEVAT